MIDYNNLVQLNTQLKQNPFASCITIADVKRGTVYFDNGNRTCTLEQLVNALYREKGFVTNISLLKPAIESYNKQEVKNSKPQIKSDTNRPKNKNVIPNNSSKQAVKNSKSDNSRLIGKQMLLSNAKKVFIYQNKYDMVSKKRDNYVMVSTKGDTTIVYIPETFKTDDNFNWDTSSDWDQLILEPNIKKLKIIGGQNITSTNSMFWESSVESIDLSSFDTSNVTNMVCMFYACEAQSIDFSSFNTSKVTDMDGMFEWCKVPSLDLSSFDTSKVTDMKDMFFDCGAKVTATDKRILQEYEN